MGTGTEVWVPWRDHPSRRPALAFVTRWWESHGYTVHLVDVPGEPFNLAACRNTAVARSTSPVVIVADADTIPDPGPLAAAVSLAGDGRGTVLPYTQYRSLQARGSRQALAGVPLDRCHHLAIDDACSGIFVTTRAGWAAHLGQDEQFAGWGCEDAAWHITHTTLLGPPRRVEGRVYALTHDSQDKTGEPTASNYGRIAHYLAAQGDPARIRALAGGA